jgi:hypothetical protein
VDINISVAVDAGCRLSNTAIYGQEAKYRKFGETSLGLARLSEGRICKTQSTQETLLFIAKMWPTIFRLDEQIQYKFSPLSGFDLGTKPLV